jgi:hypothetical protein
MTALRMTKRLSRPINIDALISAAVGAFLCLGATPLSSSWNLPQPFLLSVGLFLFLWAACLLLVANQSAPPLVFVQAIRFVNGAWILASAWVVLGGMFDPTPQGIAFVTLQAAGVVVAFVTQSMGLRKTARG